MKAEMPQVLRCGVTQCAYNKEHRCHAMAITVGGGTCPMCDTSLMSSKKGGIEQVNAGVGACKVGECRYNNSFECSAQGIEVTMHEDHAECETYQRR